MSYTNKGLRLLVIILIISLLLEVGYGYSLHNKQEQSLSNNKPIKGEAAISLNSLEVIEREIKGEEVHNYSISAKADDYLEIVVDQEGINTVVSLLSPANEKVEQVNEQDFKLGKKRLSAIFSSSGKYTFQVKLSSETALLGKYKIKVQEFNPATQRNRDTIKDLMYVENLVYQARKHYEEGEYKDAIPLGLKALQIHESLVGLENAKAGEYLYGLGILYKSVENYSEAEKRLIKSLEIKEIVPEKHPTDITKVILELGNIYLARGQYDEAETKFKEIIESFEKDLCDENNILFAAYNKLGRLYLEKGEYEKAELPLRKALNIREKFSHIWKKYRVESLNHLARLHLAKGDYQKSEACFQEILEIFPRALKKENSRLVGVFNGLGRLYKIQKDYDRAEYYYQKVLNIREKIDKDSLNTAVAINNLAELYRAKKDYDKAEKFGLRALAIREKNSDTRIFISQYNLAKLYLNIGEHEKANEYLQKALGNIEKYYGQEYHSIINILHSLAQLYQIKGNIAKAIDYKIRANEIRERQLEISLLIGSESQKLAFLNLIQMEKDSTLSLHLQSAPNNQQAAKMALAIILRRKGRTLDAMTNVISLARKYGTIEDRALLKEISLKQFELSTILLKNTKQSSLEVYQAKIQELREEIEKLQSQISSSVFGHRAVNSNITLQNIHQAIPSNAILIEFSTYQPYDFKTKTYIQPHYVAYTLNNQGVIQHIDLGKVELIDKAVGEFQQVLINKPGRWLSDAEKELKPKARAIDKLVMEPLRKLTLNAQHLFISPEGQLNIIPFDAFVDEQGKYLIENYTISYLTSGRDLIRLKNKPGSSQTSVIVSAPNYGKGKGPKIAENLYNYLSPLPNTYKEAEAIKNFLPNSQVYFGNNAIKKVVQEVNQPEILHIATHGYFLEKSLPDATYQDTQDNYFLEDSQPVDAINNSDTQNVFETKSYLELTALVYKQLNNSNPLLKSGLFFAGANNADTEDGVMTALEVSSLNLFGTKLVVLSACETGLGEIKKGEGVYGLRRALVLAGAETQVTSLWAVNDFVTKKMMVKYYGLLKKGYQRAEAMRKVQLSLLKGENYDREQQKNKLKKKNTPYSHPYYWASFIQSGEWKAMWTEK